MNLLILLIIVIFIILWLNLTKNPDNISPKNTNDCNDTNHTLNKENDLQCLYLVCDIVEILKITRKDFFNKYNRLN